MTFPFFKCRICLEKRLPWRALCGDCGRLFEVVRENLGKMGISQLMDTLIATGIPKTNIKKFLESDPQGRGSVMDQILAQLTNNLAAGMGVKETDMTAEDVKKIRTAPAHGVSTKPVEESATMLLNRRK